MGNLSILSRSEIEGLGPPMLEELADSGIHEQFLCDLALKHVAMLPEPSTTTVADRLHVAREDERNARAKRRGRHALCDARSWLGARRAPQLARRIPWTSSGFARRL